MPRDGDVGGVDRAHGSLRLRERDASRCQREGGHDEEEESSHDPCTELRGSSFDSLDLP